MDMVYISPKGLWLLNLATQKSELIVPQRLYGIVVGTRTRIAFFTNANDSQQYVVNLDTKKVTLIKGLPGRAHITSVNADETLVAGSVVEANAPDLIVYQARAIENAAEQLKAAREYPSLHPNDKDNVSVSIRMENEIRAKARAEASKARFAAHHGEQIFTQNLKTGKVQFIHQGSDWLSHIQFSPTDTELLMYAHEGPALELDRVWSIRADGSHNHLVHYRHEPNEIATHEFWSHDGKTIYYELQTKKGEDFSLAAVDVGSGNATAMHVTKAEASIHYNVSADGKLFCGDGNVISHGEVGVHGHRTLDRRWIELLRPAADGTLHSTRLAHLANNDYTKEEPNARFSPDGKSILFTSNMFGYNYVFMVDIAQSVENKSALSSAGR